MSNIVKLNNSLYKIDVDQFTNIVDQTNAICRIYAVSFPSFDNQTAMMLLDFCDNNVSNVQGFLFEYMKFWINQFPLSFSGGVKNKIEALLMVMKIDKGTLTFQEWVNRTTIE